MTKILFVIPPYFNISDYLDDSITRTLPSFTMPYGLLSIDAYIKKNTQNKIETQIIDLNIELFKILKNNNCHKNEIYILLNILENKVNSYQPDIVGISALFDTNYNYLKPISDIIKKVNNNEESKKVNNNNEKSKSILVTAGGGLPTNLYKKILEECPNIDVICYGEGEIPYSDLINSTDYQKLIEKHDSWINRNTMNSKIPSNSFVYDLDEIPEFDYSLINLNDYNTRSLDKNYQENKREMSIHTSRGCPFDCIFCANGKMHGKHIRFMSTNKVISEVKHMMKFGLTKLIIEDDHFLANKERAKEILRELSKFNIQIEFPNGLALYNIDEEIGTLLKKAGTILVSLAIESGSDYVLEQIIRKPLKVSMIKPKVEILRNNNIKVHAYIVIGLPGETHKDRLKTLKMLKNVGFDWVHIFIAIPIVGSRLYNICINNNYLINSDMSNHITTKANIKAPNIEPVEIEEFAYYMNLDVNFANNYNMLLATREGYSKAITDFQNVIQKYPEHAFAHYFLAKIYEQANNNKLKSNNKKLIKEHIKNFNWSIEKNKDWKKYSILFGLTN